jgi:hypothetical protein
MLTEIEEAYIASNPQTNADIVSGRYVEPDKSVRPSRDTGFRMATPILTKPYENPNIKAFRDVPLVETIHNDDMTDIGPGTLNGLPLDSVRLYNINYEQATQRSNYWTQRQLSDKAGETCLCETPFAKGWPWSVPCTDCGAGL